MLFDRFALPVIDSEDAYRVSFRNASEHKSIPPDIDLPLWLEVVREPEIVFQNPRTKRQNLARSWHLHLQLLPMILYRRIALVRCGRYIVRRPPEGSIINAKTATPGASKYISASLRTTEHHPYFISKNHLAIFYALCPGSPFTLLLSRGMLL